MGAWLIHLPSEDHRTPIDISSLTELQIRRLQTPSSNTHSTAVEDDSRKRATKSSSSTYGGGGGGGSGGGFSPAKAAAQGRSNSEWRGGARRRYMRGEEPSSSSAIELRLRCRRPAGAFSGSDAQSSTTPVLLLAVLVLIHRLLLGGVEAEQL
ncbi:hypothetical protein OsI_33250 [Oryza sativa Indica Group]|uniref:Uncharacterized protein n=1 Tax=Oryza sativa subsp. indica TaxID=39946 RepID=A2Z6H0_ORYSI|nr:hypothetical protein OsI_33250 [Oryza sativa Indica Group]